jgi:circadian clock protein KaiC
VNRLEKLQTGVPGLDTILGGGIPKGSLVLVEGPPGTGKTILTTQIAFHQASANGRVLMLTALSEANAKLIAYLNGLEYFRTERIGDSIQILNIQRLLTTEGLEGTLAEIRGAVIEQHIDLLIVDSLRSLTTLSHDPAGVQSFIFGLGSALFMVGCTTILVEDQYAVGGAASPEQAISDTILRLQVTRDGRAAHRQIEVVKIRGANPLTGGHSFEIGNAGLQVYPRLESLSPPEGPAGPAPRLGWGTPGLDALTAGGLPAHSSTLVLGTAGVGKTTLGLQFVAEGVAHGEPCLYVTYHETGEDLLSKADEFGLQLRSAVDSDLLRFFAVPPADINIDKVMLGVLAAAQEHGVRRLVIDTVTAFERDTVREGRFTDALTALARFLRTAGVTTLFLREMPQLIGQALELDGYAGAPWTAIDNIVLIRPAEIDGSLTRVISVLKMRGSDHRHSFYRARIAEAGLRVEGELEGLEGVLTGLPRRVS